MDALKGYFSHKPYIIAGPCSIESPQQLNATIEGIKKAGVNIIRAGIWKPRSRPNAFEGSGEKGLAWLQDAKREFLVKTAVEVANPTHVELALKYEVDILWIGARTTVNPFSVQAIADALQGVNTPVLVKNPVNPDLPLWVGAIERIQKSGIQEVGAVHRGFSAFQPGKYRNTPAWQIPIGLRQLHPEIPLFCDPSHIAGDRKMVYEVCQTAMDFNYDGLMIEVHHDPDNAWSDALQQITPSALEELLKKLQVRTDSCDNPQYVNNLQALREKIDEVDRELVEILTRRMHMVDQIGNYKKQNNITVFQLERWQEIIESRPEWAMKLGISCKLVEEVYKAIHTESLKRQTEILNSHND